MRVLSNAELDLEVRERHGAVFVVLAERDREIQRLREKVTRLKNQKDNLRLRARAGRCI